MPPPIPSCVTPLGMQNYHIANHNIQASSMWHHSHSASNARLHFKSGSGRTGGWSAKYNNNQQWLQVSKGLFTSRRGTPSWWGNLPVHVQKLARLYMQCKLKTSGWPCNPGVSVCDTIAWQVFIQRSFEIWKKILATYLGCFSITQIFRFEILEIFRVQLNSFFLVGGGAATWLVNTFHVSLVWCGWGECALEDSAKIENVVLMESAIPFQPVRTKNVEQLQRWFVNPEKFPMQ